MGNKLKNLEPIDGYFHEREAIVEKEWYKSAPLAIGVLFFILGLVSLGVGFYLIKPALFSLFLKYSRLDALLPS